MLENVYRRYFVIDHIPLFNLQHNGINAAASWNIYSNFSLLYARQLMHQHSVATR